MKRIKKVFGSGIKRLDQLPCHDLIVTINQPGLDELSYTWLNLIWYEFDKFTNLPTLDQKHGFQPTKQPNFNHNLKRSIRSERLNADRNEGQMEKKTALYFQAKGVSLFTLVPRNDDPDLHLKRKN